MSMMIAAKSVKKNDVVEIKGHEVVVTKVETYRRFGRRWVLIDYYYPTVVGGKDGIWEDEAAVPADVMLPWRGEGLDL